MSDAGFEELIPLCPVAKPLVKIQHADLGVQLQSHRSPSPRDPCGERHQSAADAAAAVFPDHRDTPDMPGFALVVQPRRTHDRIVRCGYEVNRRIISIVHLELCGNSLLLDEDRAPHRQGSGPIAVASGHPDHESGTPIAAGFARFDTFGAHLST